MSEEELKSLRSKELDRFAAFFRGAAGESLAEADRTVLKAFSNWRASPTESGVPFGSDALVRKGDTVLWREKLYVVTAVFKSTVHLEGRTHSIKIRCLKPVAEGGFDEASVVRRAGY